jgi:hypothetical protein
MFIQALVATYRDGCELVAFCDTILRYQVPEEVLRGELRPLRMYEEVDEELPIASRNFSFLMSSLS